MNALRRLLLGPGRLPDDLRAALRAEGMVLLVEGAPGSATYRNLKTPGRRANWKRTAVSAAVALSTKRFVVHAHRFKHIDVPITDLARYRIKATNPAPDRLQIDYDLSTTNPTRQGRVTLSLKTEEAARIIRILTQPRP
ncbi:hypothetical protein GCM10009830_02050 [Glycomyces endophyticus]|uniref:PH domain-containing protein n=1 Tax=Glycomyces endophyticus TaxID=480996 RepID=A0ABP4RRK4_9ACTN